VTINGSNTFGGGGVANGANVNFNQVTVDGLAVNVAIVTGEGANITSVQNWDMNIGPVPGTTDGTNLNLYGGDAGIGTDGDAGLLQLEGGQGHGNGQGGSILIYAGVNYGTGAAGNVSIDGGYSVSPSTNKGGPVVISGGLSDLANGGDVILKGGPGTTPGDVYVGQANTRHVYVGASGVDVALVGNVTINGSVPAAGIANGANVNFNQLTVSTLTSNVSLSGPNNFFTANVDTILIGGMTVNNIPGLGTFVTNQPNEGIFFNAIGNGGIEFATNTGTFGFVGNGAILMQPSANIELHPSDTLDLGEKGYPVKLFGGGSRNGAGGDVVIDGGVSVALTPVAGDVYIGANQTSNVIIGANGVNVALVGNVTINGSNTFGGGGVANGANVNFNQLVTSNTTVNNELLVGNSTFNLHMVPLDADGTIYLETAGAGLSILANDAANGLIEIASGTTIAMYSGAGDIDIGINGNGLANVGWDVNINGGASNSNRAGGINLYGGQSSVSGNGGIISIYGGNAWGGTGGDVHIQGGRANNGNHGVIHIGEANTTQVHIGAPSVNTVIGVANSYGILVSNNRVEIFTDQANLGVIDIGYTPGGGANTTGNTLVRIDNLRVEQTFRVPDFNAADLRAITQTTGAMAAVTDNEGKIAYWNSSNNAWLYVANDTPV
jgi:hypothetical protein